MELENRYKSYYLDNYAIVDFKKKLIGFFTGFELENFFRLKMTTLIKFIKTGNRYNLLYYIYTKTIYLKNINGSENALTDKKSTN